MQGEQSMDPTVRDLIYQIKFGSNAQRNDAIDTAPFAGTKAIPHLARLLDKWVEPGQFRASQEALRRIALNAYRSRGEEILVTNELVKLISADVPVNLRREALTLLSFAQGGTAVSAIAPLLQDPQVREEARMALERNPTRAAEIALKSSVPGATGEWKAALEYSIRHRRVSFKHVGTRR